MIKQWSFLSILTVMTILASAVIVLAEFGTFGNVQGQGNITQGNVTIGNVTLTPQQKDAICNPNNPLSKLNPVNTTESRICGIPVTLKPSNTTTSSAANTTTGTQEASPPPPATSIAPSATPPS